MSSHTKKFPLETHISGKLKQLFYIHATMLLHSRYYGNRGP